MSGLGKRIGNAFTFGVATLGAGVAVVLGWTLGLLGLAFLVTFFVKGPPWAIEHIFPWLQTFAKYAFLGMLAVLPFALFRRTRLFAAVALKIGGYVMGLNFWAWSIIATYTLAGGMLAVVLGLVLGAGFGVVPIALVAALVKKEWEGALSWLVMLAACLVPNLLSAALFVRAERDAEREPTGKPLYRLRFHGRGAPQCHHAGEDDLCRLGEQEGVAGRKDGLLLVHLRQHAGPLALAGRNAVPT